MKSTKIIALLLVAVMCFSVLASCGGNKNPEGDGSGSGTQTGNKYTPIDVSNVILGQKRGVQHHHIRYAQQLERIYLC